MTNTPLPLRSLPARLGREWALLAQRPTALRRARSWALDVEVDSLDDLTAACGLRSVADRLGSRPDQERAEREEDVLRRLLLLARHDDLAARVVLQRLLPGLMSAARRWGRRRGEGAAGLSAFDELLAEAWQVIRTYPVERRPHHLAAQLLRDTEYHAFVRAGRRLMVVEPVEQQHLDGEAPEPRVTAAEELAGIVSTAPLTDHDRRLLRLLVDGHSTVEVAAELSVSERTVRNHKDAMVHRLRTAACVAV